MYCISAMNDIESQVFIIHHCHNNNYYVGLIVQFLPAFQNTSTKDFYDDEPYWHVSVIAAYSIIQSSIQGVGTHVISIHCACIYYIPSIGEANNTLLIVTVMIVLCFEGQLSTMERVNRQWFSSA